MSEFDRLTNVSETAKWRFMAVVGALAAGGGAFFVGLITWLGALLYRWEACSYDAWNAIVATFGVACVATLMGSDGRLFALRRGSEGSRG